VTPDLARTPADEAGDRQRSDGRYTRHYWAYQPAIQSARETFLHSGSPDELASQMLASEPAARMARPRPSTCCTEAASERMIPAT
jgi:hypothetical protein